MSEKYTMKQTGSGGMAGSTQTPANSHLGQDKPKVFDAAGAVGHQFTEDGAIGGTAQKIGGPLDKDGAIGKQFTTEGSIGGAVQDKLGGTASRSN
ncbi:hypothetical protein UCDDA912_g03347 [Diaporthe ampelina]|uniref:Uncharacterized protein n=1 Tax=Diaporthe ampelina TaxID=1214573 RepID=A0A0G2IAA8_9PEZI|nr:hypothetical protein UCDDA912_g03347 [Diaporthe ampelina]